MMQTDRSHQATRLDAITGRYDPVLLLLTLALVGIGVVKLLKICSISMVCVDEKN